MAESSLKEQLRCLEERLLNPEIRKSTEELDSLLADDLVEFGSSGGVANKQQTIEGLLQESPLKLTLTDFEIRILAPCVVLATYRSLLHNDMRHALRSSVWKLNDGQWQMVFHQGTVTSAKL